ncbi:MAG: hypothetical protein ACFFDO_00220 [Candidatus Thorarchaeota archaeon]
MSNENNSEKEKENIITKGWNDFVSGLKDGFEKFKTNLENQSLKNVENWEKAKGKVGNFFKKMNNNWDKQVKEWDEGIKEIQEQNKEQWEARKERIREDFERWQNNMRQDWNEGVKSWNRGMIKGAWIFLIVMIPIIIILFAIVYIFRMLMEAVP